MRARKRFAALTAAILTALSGEALAQEYDAQQAKSWMAQFAQALLQFSPINDPGQTLDPARPGEYLQEYEFGTVQAATSGTPTAAQIEEIDVSTAQVTDARGVRVGMTLSEALGGLSIPQAEGNLAVVSTQETGVGWCWAYLGEDGVSAYGVLMYVQFVFVAIYIGYSIGCAPIVGFHYGAQNHPELKNMLRMSVILMSASGVVLTVLARVLAAPLAKIFVGYDEGLFTLTCHAFRLFSYAFLFAGFNIFASSFFTALGNGRISAAISFLRTLVFQTAVVLVLPALMGTDGIWLAIVVAELLALAVSAWFLWRKRGKYRYA